MRCILAKTLAIIALVAIQGPLILGAEESLPELHEITTDSLILKDGTVIPCTILEYNPGAVVKFKRIGKEGSETWQANRFREIIRAVHAADVIKKRLAMIKAAPKMPGRAQSAIETFDWAIKKKEDALISESCVAIAMTIPESIALAEWIVAYKGKTPEGLASLETYIRTVLGHNPSGWIDGRMLLLSILEKPEREADLITEIDSFLKASPSNPAANRLRARMSEAKSDLTSALEAYLRVVAADPKDVKCLEGLARVSLLSGDFRRAGESATALLELDANNVLGKGIAGTMLLKEGGKDAEALVLLEGGSACGGKLEPIVRSNRALALARLGRRNEAVQIWKDLKTDYGRLAIAIVEHKTIPEQTLVFEDQRLDRVRREHDACMRLSIRSPDLAAVRSALPKGSIRQGLFDLIADLLQSAGSTAYVKMLQNPGFGIEGQRWAAYGHIIAGRYADAAAYLATLPADDGWVVCAQVYVAAKLKDQPQARKIYETVLDPLARKTDLANPPPPDYLAMLASHFHATKEQYRRTAFDMPDGELLPPGWSAEAQGTGIGISIKEGFLVLDGTQAEARPARAVQRTLAGQLNEIIAVFRPDDLGQAIVGIEILDSAKKSGLAVGFGKNLAIQWRQIVGGRPQAWTLAEPKQNLEKDGRLRLFILPGGRVALPDPKDLRASPVVIGAPVEDPAVYYLTVFGEGPVKSTWKFAVDQVDSR